MSASVISREELLRLGPSGDGVIFVNLATQALAESPADDELRWLLVQRLIRCGLFHRALETCKGFDQELLERADFADLRQKLSASKQNGLADWRTFADGYASRCAIARRLYAWVDAMDAAWRAASLELHKTSDGRWQVFESDARRWRPAFGPLTPPQRVEDIARQVADRVIAPIVIDGIALGAPLDVYWRATRDTLHGASPLIYVVEPSLVAVAAALHLNAWEELLTDERVVWCVGDDAHRAFEREIAARADAPQPGSIVASPLWQTETTGRTQEIVRTAEARNKSRAAEARSSAEAAYRDCDTAWWAERYRSALSGRGEPLRVMAVTSRYTTVLQYSTRDAMEAFSELGCRTLTLIEPDLHSFVSPTRALTAIREFAPDLVFFIDHTRRTQLQNLIANVPVVTWVQDRLNWLYDASSGRAMGALDFCMGHGADELIGKHDYPAERFMPCEMATHPDALLPRGDIADPPEFECDVAYATHASEPPDVLHRRMREGPRGAHLGALIDAIYDELCGMADRGVLNGSLHLDFLIVRLAASTNTVIAPLERDEVAANFARPLAERLLRQQTIEWAANWARETGGTLHLYGKGWEQHPQFAPFARGTIAHGRELGAAFRGAKIHLHAGCNPALHQRVFDGLAAGGFFLIRKHGADVAHRVSRAIRDWIVQGGRMPGVALHKDDLPEFVRAEYAELRRYNGHDPQAPFVQTARHVEQYRRLFETKTVQLAGQVWPEIDRIVFSSESEFRLRLEHYLAHPEERAAVAASMRKVVLERYSYRALMDRLVRWMADQLERQAARDEESGIEDVKCKVKTGICRGSQVHLQPTLSAGRSPS